MAKLGGKTIKVTNGSYEMEISETAWNMLHQSKDGSRSGFKIVAEKPKEVKEASKNKD